MWKQAPSKWEWQATSTPLLTALASLSSLGFSGPLHSGPYCIFSNAHMLNSSVPLPVPWLHWDTCVRLVEAVRDHAVQEHRGSEDSWAGGWQLSLGQHRQDVLTGGMLEVWHNLLWQLAQGFLLLEKGGKTRGPFGLARNIFGYLSPSKWATGYQHVKYTYTELSPLHALEILPDRINVWVC